MARKSRKIDFVNVGRIEKPVVAKEEATVFHAGLYARLSLEREANKERGTIENQMEFLREFAGSEEDIIVEQEYWDVSQTGTHFQREGFEKMMRDIRDRRINCVIVKDLSRLGRNYVEAGNYVERVFPFFEVRFISVIDGYDSARGDADLSVSMAHIFNEFYSRDLAKKVRASFRSYWQKGNNVSGNLAYGLMADPMDQHHIVADPDTAPVVLRIFEMFVKETMGYAQIAKALNKDGIIGPKAYKHFQRTKELPEHYDIGWKGRTIARMLCNPYYAGDSRHNHHGRDSFAKKKQWEEPEENWIMVENTHEPVVPRELYLKAQERLKEVHKNSPYYGRKREGELSYRNFYKKKIVCGDCGATMYLVKSTNGKASFVCSRHRLKGNCDAKRILESAVNDEVFHVIQSRMKISFDSMETWKEKNGKTELLQVYEIITKEIQKLHREIEKLAVHRQQLYEDYAERRIDAGQYEIFAEKNAMMERELRKKMEEATRYCNHYDRKYCSVQDWKQVIKKYQKARHLTKTMVDALVEKVELFSGGKIMVHLTYDDLLEELVVSAKEWKEKGDAK